MQKYRGFSGVFKCMPAANDFNEYRRLDLGPDLAGFS